jgi:hypothetical protein
MRMLPFTVKVAKVFYPVMYKCVCALIFSLANTSQIRSNWNANLMLAR